MQNSDYPGTYSRWRFKDNSRFANMSDDPKYLVRYLNEVERWCRKGKYYSSRKEQPAGSVCVDRYSKVLFSRDYGLTGDWTSGVVDDYTGDKRWEYVRKGRTIKNYVDDLLCDFFTQWQRSKEDNFDDEAIEEEILNNDDYAFLEDGRRYCA